MTDLIDGPETEPTPEPEFVCDVCGKGFANAAGLGGHKRSHSEESLEARAATPPTAAPAGQPALIPEWRSTPRVRVGIRSLTMLRPVCRICEAGDNAPLDWYRSCRHDPYVTQVPIDEQVPEYEPEMVNGVPTGRQLVKGMRTARRWEPRPNAVGISVSEGTNGGVETGRRHARAKGFIMPSELRSPSYPDGIRDTCQFHDCKQQQGLKRYTVGIFCREMEAQLVWHVETGKTIHVGEWSPDAIQARTDQLQEAQIGQGVAV